FKVPESSPQVNDGTEGSILLDLCFLSLEAARGQGRPVVVADNQLQWPRDRSLDSARRDLRKSEAFGPGRDSNDDPSIAHGNDVSCLRHRDPNSRSRRRAAPGEEVPWEIRVDLTLHHAPV